MCKASFNFLGNAPRENNPFFLPRVFSARNYGDGEERATDTDRNELLLPWWTQYYRGARRGLRYRAAVVSDKRAVGVSGIVLNKSYIFLISRNKKKREKRVPPAYLAESY